MNINQLFLQETPLYQTEHWITIAALDGRLVDVGWNLKKAASNISKHKSVTLEEGIPLICGSSTEVSLQYEEGEWRELQIGVGAKGYLVALVVKWIEEDLDFEGNLCVRLISCRKTTAAEERAYMKKRGLHESAGSEQEEKEIVFLDEPNLQRLNRRLDAFAAKKAKYQAEKKRKEQEAMINSGSLIPETKK